MIRATLLKVVLDALTSHPFFAGEDFDVQEFANTAKDPCIAITYRYDSTFCFNFHVPKSKTKLEYGSGYIFSCTVNPGRESAVETISAEDRRGLIAEIGAWLERLHEDVLSAPVVRQFAAHAASIDQIRERLEQLPDELLSREDVAKYNAALDQLKAELTEQLRRETADKDTLKHRIEELGRDVDFLKSTQVLSPTICHGSAGSKGSYAAQYGRACRRRGSRCKRSCEYRGRKTGNHEQRWPLTSYQ